MIKDNDVVRVTNIDYSGTFKVQTANNLTILPGDTKFSLVAVVYPTNPMEFVAYAREHCGFLLIGNAIDDIVVELKHLEVVNEQDI